MKQKSFTGFTLIETLVSVAIFTLAVSLGTMTLLSMNRASGRMQVRDQAVQSAYYVMDTISRSIRTGTKYEEINGGTGFKYVDQKGDTITLGKNTSGQIEMTTKPSSSSFTTTESLHDASIVSVAYAAFDENGLGTTDGVQPSVTVVVDFQYVYRGKTFSIPIQTTLTQRYIDVDSALGEIPITG
jgi:prepilin-type N-terminal cleavage/methylation domain-containing protein